MQSFMVKFGQDLLIDYTIYIYIITIEKGWVWNKRFTVLMTIILLALSGCANTRDKYGLVELTSIDHLYDVI